jgi:hypothetical protein
MSETKVRFRTNQEEYFEPIDMQDEEAPPPASNGKLFAVLALGVLIAASIATLLSVAF